MADATVVAPPRTRWLDAVGITVSVVCAIHCAASGVVLAGLALLGVARVLPPWLEWAFFATSMVIGTIALRHRCRSHGQRRPLQLFAAGIGLLLGARLIGDGARLGEIALVLSGAGCIVAAHVRNWQHGKTCVTRDHDAVSVRTSP